MNWADELGEDVQPAGAAVADDSVTEVIHSTHKNWNDSTTVS